MTRVRIRHGIFINSGKRAGFLILVFLLFYPLPSAATGEARQNVSPSTEAAHSTDCGRSAGGSISGWPYTSGQRGPACDSTIFIVGQTGRNEDNPFPDYVPKSTPDTVLDYRGALYTRIEKLPSAVPGSLPELIRLLSEYKRLAAENPGYQVKGNVALGADPIEYQPSDEELLCSEIGKRIGQAVEASSKEILATILQKAGITTKEITFNEFTFRHVDVMGSGRYFFSSGPEKNRILLEK